MRILHTSDWHIGKRLLGRERLAEQADALDEIAALCAKEQIDVVLVAGDVFDTYLPSAEAEDLFYEKIKKIAGDTRAVVVISGNHDDNVRLSAATPLCEPQGIYIYGNYGYVPKRGGNRPVRIADSGPNHIVLEKGGDKIFVNILPYPNETRLKEDKNPDETFLDKMSRWMQSGQAKNTDGLPSVFLSHLFVAGGQVSEGERDIDLGGARAVPLSLLPKADYAALGHLHKCQQFKGNVCYSGAILQYAFDEAGAAKSVFIFDLDRTGVHNMERRILQSGRSLVRLEANGIAAAEELLYRYENSFIELTIHLDEPMASSQVKQLKDANEGLVSIVPLIGSALPGENAAARKQLSPIELFCEFYKSRFSEQPSDEMKELFVSAMEESNET